MEALARIFFFIFMFLQFSWRTGYKAIKIDAPSLTSWDIQVRFQFASVQGAHFNYKEPRSPQNSLAIQSGHGIKTSNHIQDNLQALELH